ncbi:hypothetical protein POM88_001363 [Heracleum sosnowskyi]|uniref:Uncharacterized protein n=1 Tax=Heracleum sosnowskyi TaxID=360622 RepID=A0AAD8JER3_9APIA|nr:hypothetical protein POM88_001363 [Heracleum sosnowskyi]
MDEPPTVTPLADSNISGQDVVPSAHPNYDEVLIEDVSDDDVPLYQLIKALGLESSNVRSDEITQKNPESVRTPSASNPHSFPSPPRRLRTGGPSTQTVLRLEALENRCLSMETKLDSLSTMVAFGFASIQQSLQLLSASFDAANLPKGEKEVRSESVQEKGNLIKEVPVSQGELGRQGS